MKRTERIRIQSASEAETVRIGEAVGRRIDRGLCICLVGVLGTGKSVLARGLCRGLDVDEAIVSPTFILHEEYAGRLPVVHADFYRLDHEREIEELGLFERIGGDAVILVEWGDRSPTLVEHADLLFELTTEGPTERSIEVSYGPREKELFEGLQ